MSPENIIYASAVISGIVGMGAAFTWGRNHEKNRNGYVKGSDCRARNGELKTQIGHIHAKINETNESVARIEGYLEAHLS